MTSGKCFLVDQGGSERPWSTTQHHGPDGAPGPLLVHLDPAWSTSCNHTPEIADQGGFRWIRGTTGTMELGVGPGALWSCFYILLIDLKPDKVKRWFREVKKYLSKHDVNDDTEDVVDYYGIFTEERTHNAYLTLLDEYGEVSPTLEQFKTRFQQLFEASTNTDNLYQKWQRVQQTTGGNPTRISKIVGGLADLNGALPRDSISDYAERQHFLDAMDPRLRQNVEPQIRETNTWDHIVQLAE